MTEQDPLQIIPPQYTGTDIEVHATAEFESTEDAAEFFIVARRRLLNVNEWHKVAGLVSASFQAIDKDGNKVNRPIEKGDYMRVDIPGPVSKEGDGYDWVTAEEVKEINTGEIQSIGFRVRPVANPFGDTNNIAHFYDDSSTSNFIVMREGKRITAGIVDRNTKPNEATSSLTDKVRGTAIGLGAIAIFSRLQWQSLANGIVNTKK